MSTIKKIFGFKDDDYDDYEDDDREYYDNQYDDYEEEEKEKEAFVVRPNNNSYAKSQELSIVVHTPKTFNDCLVIIDNIKNNNPVVFSLESVDDDFGQRMIDLLSGAAHAISGELRQISVNSDKIFLLAPALVSIDASMMKDIDKETKQVFSAVDIGRFKK